MKQLMKEGKIFKNEQEINKEDLYADDKKAEAILFLDFSEISEDLLNFLHFLKNSKNYKLNHIVHLYP